MRRPVVILAALALALVTAMPAAAAGKAGQRPLSDWIDAQQAALDPTIAVEVQAVQFFDPTTGWNLIADMDGRIALWVSANGGDSYTPNLAGTVTERLLADGRALVKVEVRYAGAITYVWQDEGDYPNGPELFGYRASEIAAGASAALGSGFFHLTFISPTPGGPLPNLDQLAFAPFEGQEILAVSFHNGADGALREASGWPDGTPGTAATQQVGVFHASFKGATGDGFPVEWVTIAAR
jgi:hypothetical protein